MKSGRRLLPFGFLSCLVVVPMENWLPLAGFSAACGGRRRGKLLDTSALVRDNLDYFRETLVIIAMWCGAQILCRKPRLTLRSCPGGNVAVGVVWFLRLVENVRDTRLLTVSAEPSRSINILQSPAATDCSLVLQD